MTDIKRPVKRVTNGVRVQIRGALQSSCGHRGKAPQQESEGTSMNETVDLIASGYEWVCPACDKLNKEIEAKQTVTCKDCHETFEANTPEHAYE